MLLTRKQSEVLSAQARHLGCEPSMRSAAAQAGRVDRAQSVAFDGWRRQIAPTQDRVGMIRTTTLGAK